MCFPFVCDVKLGYSDVFKKKYKQFFPVAFSEIVYLWCVASVSKEHPGVLGPPSHGGGGLCSLISRPIRTQTSLIIGEATSFVVALFLFFCSFKDFYHVADETLSVASFQDRFLVLIMYGLIRTSSHCTCSAVCSDVLYSVKSISHLY